MGRVAFKQSGSGNLRKVIFKWDLKVVMDQLEYLEKYIPGRRNNQFKSTKVGTWLYVQGT